MHRRSCLSAARLAPGQEHFAAYCDAFSPDHVLGGAENLRVELWGPFLTVSGTRKGGAMGMRDPARRGAGGKGVILRREMDYGFFSASWRLPVSTLLTQNQNQSTSLPATSGESDAWLSLDKPVAQENITSMHV